MIYHFKNKRSGIKKRGVATPSLGLWKSWTTKKRVDHNYHKPIHSPLIHLGTKIYKFCLADQQPLTISLFYL